TVTSFPPLISILVVVVVLVSCVCVWAVTPATHIAARPIATAVRRVVCMAAPAARSRVRALKDEGRADSPPLHGLAIRATWLCEPCPIYWRLWTIRPPARCSIVHTSAP